jgi:hypothetical protein
VKVYLLEVASDGEPYSYYGVYVSPEAAMYAWADRGDWTRVDPDKWDNGNDARIWVETVLSAVGA